MMLPLGLGTCCTGRTEELHAGFTSCTWRCKVISQQIEKACHCRELTMEASYTVACPAHCYCWCMSSSPPLHAQHKADASHALGTLPCNASSMLCRPQEVKSCPPDNVSAGAPLRIFRGRHVQQGSDSKSSMCVSAASRCFLSRIFILHTTNIAYVPQVHQLVDKADIVREGWNGYNVLHDSASRVAAMDVGFLPSARAQADTPPAKVVYLLGSDDFSKQDIPKDAFVIYQVSAG